MLNFLFKPTCIFCDELTYRNFALCRECEQNLPFLKNYCQKCAAPVPENQNICGACLKLQFDINTTALFHYESPIDKLIMNLKFQGDLIGADILGQLLATYLLDKYNSRNKPEIIVPIPLHYKRLRERGYNQALEIARPISKKLSIPLDLFSVVREKQTAPQAQLHAKERNKNIKNAFGVISELNYQYIAIVDDVITTGATVFELCKVLYKAGVKKIDVWSVAVRGQVLTNDKGIVNLPQKV